LEISPEDAADYLGTFEGAAQSACWFWESNNLNAVADAGDIKKMTKIINGGYIGLADRESHYQHALQIMGA
jgi:putative chitinase